jgi:hypothetical protein
MTRVLPGVYVEFHDYSMLPEGETNLAVGYVLASPRGPVGKAELVTSPADFLSKFTFTGSPTIKDDKTFWSILQVLKYTNEVYISRAAKNVKFGGLTVRATGATPWETGMDDPTNFDFDVDAVPAHEAVPAQGTEGEDGYVPAQPATEAVEGTKDVLFILAGKDGGTYNNNIGIEIISYKDQPEKLLDEFGETSFVDENGNLVITTAAQNMAVAKPFRIIVYDCTNPNEKQELERFTVSLVPGAKTFDGTVLDLASQLEGSAYIQCVVPEDIRTGEFNTSITTTKLAGGTCAEVSEMDYTDAVHALEVFEDKTIPISLFGNGTGTMYENADYQQALVALSQKRQDFLAFLNSRLKDEKATANSTKALNIVNYKKGASEGGLGATYWGACMYAPHVNYSDVFNSRKIKLGADSTAIAGWLNVILGQGYPFVYAGPQDGLVTGVTCDWKIGDISGEAAKLNDASVNYVAYDAKVGRYYMQCQNTLQIANSSLRNIGAVLNILDIKQTFMTYFKEYLQKPITPRLREEIWTKGNDYLKDKILGMNRCVNYAFVDATTDLDLADNTLRYILTIALTPYAQKIYLHMNIVNANYDFSITQG